MRQSFCRALLVLALLVPLSRSSFGDTFAVGGTLVDSGDIEEGFINLPSGTVNFAIAAGDFPFTWKIGSVEEGAIILVGGGSGSGWSFDGFTGLLADGTFRAVTTEPFTVEDYGAAGLPVTWTGELDLLTNDGLELFEIQMAGTGTASFIGSPDVNDEVVVTTGTADVTGVGQVVYEDPSVPEPSTLTLMGIAGIASIILIGFRRRYSDAKLGHYLA